MSPDHYVKELMHQTKRSMDGNDKYDLTSDPIYAHLKTNFEFHDAIKTFWDKEVNWWTREMICDWNRLMKYRFGSIGTIVSPTAAIVHANSERDQSIQDCKEAKEKLYQAIRERDEVKAKLIEAIRERDAASAARNKAHECVARKHQDLIEVKTKLKNAEKSLETIKGTIEDFTDRNAFVSQVMDGVPNGSNGDDGSLKRKDPSAKSTGGKKVKN